MIRNTEFEKTLIEGFWKYVESNPELSAALDIKDPDRSRPPVFARGHEHENVLCSPGAPPAVRMAVLAALPSTGHHKWFRSMSSSQALAQSVFANLSVLGGMAILEDLPTDSGEPLIGKRVRDVALEYPINSLGELKGHKTSVDVMLSCDDDYRVAFECKLREDDIGRCSRPLVQERIRRKDNSWVDNPHYGRDHCNGSYTAQHGRPDRCALTGQGIQYWSHLPELATWSSDRDQVPCPLESTYQLARNVLAVSVDPTTMTVQHKGGHVVLVYDERNPAFGHGGSGDTAFNDLRNSLYHPELLRRCSWQVISRRLRDSASFRWLAEALDAKYGF